MFPNPNTLPTPSENMTRAKKEARKKRDGAEMYWTMFSYGGDNMTICSKHRSPKVAIREAKKCEKSGGNPHWVVKVETVWKSEKHR